MGIGEKLDYLRNRFENIRKGESNLGDLEDSEHKILNKIAVLHKNGEDIPEEMIDEALNLFEKEVEAAVELENEIIDLEEEELKLEDEIEISENSSNIEQVVDSLKQSENKTEQIVDKYFEEVNKLEDEALQLKKVLNQQNIRGEKLRVLNRRIEDLGQVDTRESRIEKLLTEIDEEKRNTIRNVGAAAVGGWYLKDLGKNSNQGEKHEPDTEFSEKNQDIKINSKKGELIPPGEGEVQIEYWTRFDGRPKVLQVTARNLSHSERNYNIEILLKPPNEWSSSSSFQISSGSPAMYSAEKKLSPGQSFTPRLGLHPPDQLPEKNIFKIITLYYPEGKPSKVKKSKLSLEVGHK